MMCFKINVILFVFFTTVNSQNIETIIAKNSEHVVVSPTETPYVVDILIFKYFSTKIFMYKPNYLLLPKKIKKIDVLYTSIGCMCAQWTLDVIYNFVENSSLFNKYVSVINPDNESEDDSDFKNQFTVFTDAVETVFSQLIDLLSHLFNVIISMNLSYYKDTSILDALLSLRMNTYFLSLNYYRHRRVLQYDIFRIVTKDMTAVQSYLSVNCSNMTPDNKIMSDLYGYWIYTYGENLVKDSPALYAVLKEFNLESNTNFKCIPTQTILNDFLFDNNVFTFLADTNIIISNNLLKDAKTIAIKELYHRMITSYDIDVVFWYQDSVIAAIMKIIISEMLKGLQEDESYVKSFKTLIQNIYQNVSEKNILFPEHFVNGFRILFMTDEQNKTSIDNLQNFYDSLIHVQLATNIKQSTKLQYVTNTLKKISENVDIFKCFQLSYKHLQDKHDKHYLPFINDKMIIGPIGDVEYFEKVYDFLVIVYCMCFQIYNYLTNLQGYQGHWTMRKKDKKIYSKIYNLLKNMQNYIFLIIEKRSYDLGLLQMAYDIASILVNVPMKFTGFYINYVKRFVDIIMKILTSRGLQYCTSKKPNCLLHRYIKSFDLDKKEVIKEIITAFFSKSVRGFTEVDLDRSTVSETHYNYFSINHLYENYVKTSNVIKNYEECIHFTWKGLPYTISNMFQEAKSDFLYPVVLYTLYDSFFKFYLIVVYYRIKKTLISTDWNIIKIEFEKITTDYYLKEEYFPKELKPFILDIKELIYLINVSEINKEEAMIQLTKRTEKVDRLLNKFNIILNLSKKCEIKKYCFATSLFTCHQSYDIFNDELSNNVKSLNNIFKKLNYFHVTL